MVDMDNTFDTYNVVFCKVSIGFISLSYHLMIHQIDIISRHISVAFNIPSHNISIYFNKLYCLRTLGFVIGGFVENGIFQAAGGDRDSQQSTKARIYVAVFAFTSLLVARYVYLFLLYTSSYLSYHIYVILVVEGFCFGVYDSGFMALASGFISIVRIMYGLCRIFISGSQFILDRLWYELPLHIVKIQAWLAVTFTTIAVGLWYYLYDKINPCPNGEELVKTLEEPGRAAIDHLLEKLFTKFKQLEARREAKINARFLKLFNVTHDENAINHVKYILQQYGGYRVGTDGIGTALSPALMYLATTFFNDFMFPSVLPYGLLERDKCHIINVMIPYFINLGPIVFFLLDNYSKLFRSWSWYFDMFWFLFFPLPIILTFAFKAMFTRKPAAKAIINSKVRVTCMTVMLILSFGFNEPLSFMGLGKYAFRQNPGGFTLLGFHISAALFCRYIASKIAVGFSDTRISLGYHLPKFRPNHKMSKKNLSWFIFRQTFKRTWRDAKGDLKLDIKQYL